MLESISDFTDLPISTQKHQRKPHCPLRFHTRLRKRLRQGVAETHLHLVHQPDELDALPIMELLSASPDAGGESRAERARKRRGGSRRARGRRFASSALYTGGPHTSYMWDQEPTWRTNLAWLSRVAKPPSKIALGGKLNGLN